MNWDGLRTSAKTGEGIDEAMRMMLKYIMAVDTWNRPLRDLYFVALPLDNNLEIQIFMSFCCFDSKVLLSYYLRQLKSHATRNPDEDEASAAITTLNGATLVEAAETVKLEDNAEKSGRACAC